MLSSYPQHALAWQGHGWHTNQNGPTSGTMRSYHGSGRKHSEYPFAHACLGKNDVSRRDFKRWREERVKRILQPGKAYLHDQKEDGQGRSIPSRGLDSSGSSSSHDGFCRVQLLARGRRAENGAAFGEREALDMTANGDVRHVEGDGFCPEDRTASSRRDSRVGADPRQRLLRDHQDGAETDADDLSQQSKGPDHQLVTEKAVDALDPADVKAAVEETVTQVKETVGDAVQAVVTPVADAAAAVHDTITSATEMVGGAISGALPRALPNELDSLDRLTCLGKSRKRKDEMSIISDEAGPLASLQNLYLVLPRKPPLAFAAAVCCMPVLCACFFTPFYLLDLNGLIMDDPAVQAFEESPVKNIRLPVLTASFTSNSDGSHQHPPTSSSNSMMAVSAPALSIPATWDPTSPGQGSMTLEFAPTPDALPVAAPPLVDKDGSAAVTLAEVGLGIMDPRVWLQVFGFCLGLQTGLEQMLFPNSLYTIALVNLNALAAQLLVVLMTGAVFTRLSQPTDPIRCASVALISTPLLPSSSDPISSDGSGRPLTATSSSLSTSAPSSKLAGLLDPASSWELNPGVHRPQLNPVRMLLLRYILAGPQPTELVDVKVELSLMEDAVTYNGSFLRKVTPLSLVRGDSAYLQFGMFIRHVIDESSPLLGRTQEDLELCNAQLSLSIIGMERASMQPVFHVHQYLFSDGDVIWNAEFKDMITEGQGGVRCMDHRKLNSWRICGLKV